MEGNYDVIVLFGQSNAEGNGHGETDKPYEKDERVMIMRDSRPMSTYIGPTGECLLKEIVSPEFYTEVLEERTWADGGKVGNLVFEFARRYVKNDLKEGRKLLVVYAPVGGTGFAFKQWGVGNLLTLRLHAMLDEALKDKSNRVVAMLWHQGEHDAFENANFTSDERYKFYYDNFSAFIGELENKYGLKDVPLVTGGFVNEWAKTFKEQCAAVNNATKDFCASRPRSGYVETSDLKSNNEDTHNGDNIHFCRSALYELGARYYDKFKKISK